MKRQSSGSKPTENNKSTTQGKYQLFKLKDWSGASFFTN